jgi:hypothetical protein
MTVLHHLTLTSGHLRASPRSEVGDDILTLLRPIVQLGSGVISGLHVEITDRSPIVYTLGWDSADSPWVRCVLCIEDVSHQQLTWQHARALAQLTGCVVTVPEPPQPWLAVILLPHALPGDAERWRMLGDAERCVAWALIEADRQALGVDALAPATAGKPL